MKRVEMQTEIGWLPDGSPYTAGQLQPWAYRQLCLAPDLLSALKGLLEQPCSHEAYDGIVKMAKAAIAYAEGGKRQ